MQSLSATVLGALVLIVLCTPVFDNDQPALAYARDHGLSEMYFQTLHVLTS